jgi:23S rRNA (adenine2030-N6)-methyltransferase
MLIINAPWQLDTQLDALLPRLSQQLAQSEEAQWRLEWLVKPE